MDAQHQQQQQRTRCAGHTKFGGRCRKMIFYKYCFQHENQTPNDNREYLISSHSSPFIQLNSNMSTINTKDESEVDNNMNENDMILYEHPNVEKSLSSSSPLENSRSDVNLQSCNFKDYTESREKHLSP
eukprot:Pgem_evm1s413